MTNPFVRQFDFTYGRRDQASLLIQRVVADNPGPFTFTGTGTYIVGRPDSEASVAVVDPGPLDDSHLEALLRAVSDRTVSHVFVTHTHRDHAPLARPFAQATGAAILAARPPLQETHASGMLDEDEDADFRPDIVLSGGEIVVGDGWTMEAVATPGHASKANRPSESTAPRSRYFPAPEAFTRAPTAGAPSAVRRPVIMLTPSIVRAARLATPATC